MVKYREDGSPILGSTYLEGLHMQAKRWMKTAKRGDIYPYSPPTPKTISIFDGEKIIRIDRKDHDQYKPSEQ